MVVVLTTAVAMAVQDDSEFLRGKNLTYWLLHVIEPEFIILGID